MWVKKQLLHTVLFELGAIIVTVIAISLVGGELQLWVTGCSTRFLQAGRNCVVLGFGCCARFPFERALMLFILSIIMYALGLTLWETIANGYFAYADNYDLHLSV